MSNAHFLDSKKMKICYKKNISTLAYQREKRREFKKRVFFFISLSLLQAKLSRGGKVSFFSRRARSLAPRLPFFFFRASSCRRDSSSARGTVRLLWDLSNSKKRKERRRKAHRLDFFPLSRFPRRGTAFSFRFPRFGKKTNPPSLSKKQSPSTPRGACSGPSPQRQRRARSRQLPGTLTLPGSHRRRRRSSGPSSPPPPRRPRPCRPSPRPPPPFLLPSLPAPSSSPSPLSSPSSWLPGGSACSRGSSACTCGTWRSGSRSRGKKI